MIFDEGILHLNNTVKCTLRPSQIHGIGVFALRNIGKGEQLHCVRPPITLWYEIPIEHLHRVRQEILNLILDRWPQVREGRAFLSPNDDQNLMSFMNHSDTPNSQDGLAIRDIKAGEEITEDYDTGNLSDLQKKHYSFLS